MRFRSFTIPPRKIERTGKKGEYICNTRIWVSDTEEEKYCQEKVDSCTRCEQHNIDEKARAIRQEARLAAIVDSASIAERVAELKKDKRNLTTLDELVLNSLATLQELEKRYPIATVSPSDAVTISRLREKHAELVHKRVDLEAKLKTLLDAHYLFEQSALLFEKNVTDKNTQKILLEGIGKMLNDMVQSGNAAAVEASK